MHGLKSTIALVVVLGGLVAYIYFVDAKRPATSPDAKEKAFTTLGDCLARQHELGVPSELLDADECIRMVPALSRKQLAGGSFCGKDGSASPFRWLDALLKACRREGVEIRYGTRIGKIEEANGGFRLHTANGPIEANKVVLCTDWAVPQLLMPLGIDLPVNSLPKEGLVTAPHAPTVSPIIVSVAPGMAPGRAPWKIWSTPMLAMQCLASAMPVPSLR